MRSLSICSRSQRSRSSAASRSSGRGSGFATGAFAASYVAAGAGSGAGGLGGLLPSSAMRKTSVTAARRRRAAVF